MVNPKRPDEVLNNLAPNSSGLVDLPESQVVDGVKYVLQNTEGRTYTNTLHVKPENLENYVYVPTKESTLEEGNTSASSDSSDETVSTYDVGRELSDAIVEKYPTEQELPKEEKKEAIAANLDATIALRSYFRNFVGVNPEDFAKKARTLRNRSDGRTIVIGASQHYIGAKIGAILAREGVQIQDMYELVTHLNEINPYTGRSKYYEYVADAYKELGYANSAARKLTDSFFEFIGDAHTMGIVYAVRTWESNFGLAAARVYNRKFAKAGKLAELYTATGIKLLQQELQKQGADLDTDKVADEGIKELQTLANEEVTNTEDSDVVKAYKDSVKEYLQEFSATAKGASITEADIEAALANVIRVTPDKKAIFSPSELSSSIQYALHRGYVTSKNMASVGDVITNADTVLAKVDMDYLRAVKEHSLSMLSDDGGTNLPGELIGEHLAEVFSRNGLFSNDSGNIATAQKRLIQVGLLTYAKENNLELGADWNEEQYAEALDFIKENFSISAAASQYLAYQTEYIPDNLFAAAAKNKAKLQYTIGTGSARSVLEHLADIPPQHQALAVAEPIPEQQEKPKKTEEAQPSKSAEETSEETPEESAEEEKVSLLDRILSEDDLTKYEDGKPIVLKDSAGEPKVSIFQDEDFNVHVKDLGSNEEFVIPADDPSTDELGLKLQELATESDLAQKLALNKDVLSLLANLSVKYTAPEGAEKAAEVLAEAAADFSTTQETGQQQEKTEETEAETETETEAEAEAEATGRLETEELKEEEVGEEAATSPEEKQLAEVAADAAEAQKEALAEDGLPEDIADKVKESVGEQAPETEQVSEKAPETQPNASAESEAHTEEVQAPGAGVQLGEQKEKRSLEEVFGKPLTELTKNDVYETLGNEEAMRKFGTSQLAKEIAFQASRMGIPDSYVSDLIGGKLFESLLYNNPNLIKELGKFPKNRKNILIPTITEVDGKPVITLDKFSLKNGRRASFKADKILRPPLSREDKETLKKYLDTLKKYVPPLNKIPDVLDSDKTVRQTLHEAYSGGKGHYLQRIATEARKELDNYFGEHSEDVQREAGKGRYPLTHAFVGKYSPGLYLPTQAGKEFIATNPYGTETLTGSTYGEALDKLVSSLENSAKDGKIPQDFIEVFKNTIDKDRELHKQYSGKIPEGSLKYVDDTISSTAKNFYSNIREAMSGFDLAKTATDPETYVKQNFAKALTRATKHIATEFNLPDLYEAVQRIEDAGADFAEDDMQHLLSLLGKYAPEAKKTLQHVYDQTLEMAREYKPRWERDVELQKEKAEREEKLGALKKAANDAYMSLWDDLVSKNRALTAKTAFKKIKEGLSTVDETFGKIEQESPGSMERAVKNIYSFIKKAFDEYNISAELPKADEIKSAAELAPYLLQAYNAIRKDKGKGPFKGIDGFMPPKETGKQPKKKQKKAQKKEEKPTTASVPSKSNVIAAFNTIKEKYMKGKKPPTEGRVRRAIHTQLSKMLGEGEPTKDVVDKLNEYFGTDAADYKDLLDTLAQGIVDAYDVKHSEELKEAAKKVKETSTESGEKLESGFDADDVRRGLANFIENYPIPPKAVEDMIDKYGSDFSEWSNDALEELGRRLRKDFGNNSIGQSIQEFFPKGFVVQEQIPEKEEEQESEDLEFSEEPEGPTEEDLEELENEEE